MGWQIRCELAPFKRDYLLPAPAGAYDSCLRTELRYALGYAIQNRLLARLVDDKCATVLTAEATMFWTPHSGRSFLPSCTQALGFPKDERDFLSGWSLQGSDTYSRTAKLRISSMQKSVSKVIAQGPEGDRLGERESIDPAGSKDTTLTWLRTSRRRLVSGVSAKQLENMQHFHRATWKKKLNEIEPSELKKIEPSEALDRQQVKEIEASSQQGPSAQSLIRKRFMM